MTSQDQHTRALFRADWSREMGLGHVMRLLAIAQEFASRGRTPIFVVRGDSPENSPIAQSGYPVLRMEQGTGTLADAVTTAQFASQHGCTLCFVDGYAFTSDYYATLVEHGIRVVALADWPHTEFPVDVLVNVNFGSEPKQYCVDPGTVLLFGPTFVPLRSQFLHRSRDDHNGDDHDDAVHKLLLTFGGTDPGRKTARVLALLPSSQPLAVTCVVGGPYRDDGELELAADCARRAGHRVAILRGVVDMAAVMASMKAAICAGGSTVWELAHLGVPMLAFVVARNQAMGVRDLAACGCLADGGWLDKCSDERVQTVVAQFLSDTVFRQTSASVFSRLVDGKGASRIIDAVCTAAEHG